MKREILCHNCTQKTKDIFTSPTPYPGEHVKFVSGKALRDYRCDSCGIPITPGTNCSALSIWSDRGRNKYSPWEDSFLNTEELPNV